jgi:hypothetical protein
MPDLVPPMVLGHKFLGKFSIRTRHAQRRPASGPIVTSVPYLDIADGPQLLGLSPTVTGSSAQRMLLQEDRVLG